MKILFFDGQCTLCNGLVDWFIRRDKKAVLKFASLQGETAQQMLPSAYRGSKGLDTLLYYRHGKIYIRSTAVLMSLQDLGGLWILTSVFFIIPSFLRDLVYRLIARMRYRIFGKTETCRVPKPEERQRILP
jgi:predicted DCC family thiol-disulfide oxidoreductase YuxK